MDLKIIAAAAFAGITAISCSRMDYRQYYNETLEKLCSESNHGRSEYMDGDILSARIIMDYASGIDGLKPLGMDPSVPQTPARPEYKSEVKPFGIGRWASYGDRDRYLPYLQSFCMPMNVMRGDMSVSIDGKPLRATYDFTAKEYSPTCHGEFGLVEVPDEMVTEGKFVEYLSSGLFRNCFAVIDWQAYLTLPAHPFERYKPYIGKLSKENIAGIIFKDSELFPYFKARSYYNMDIPVLMATDEAIPAGAKSIRIDLDAEMLPCHDGHNIIAYLPGTDPTKSDHYTFIAHYDHLGLMGRDNLFPGSNDNASGAAMLLTLAKYFSENRPSRGVEFIWLDTEEENLLGAFYYCENPVLPLDRTRFLINLDMVADDGDHLATEVSENGKDELGIIQKINSSSKRPFDIAIQELSDNSDHYAFALKGVPGVYFSTEGSYYVHYHSPRDTYSNSTDENFERLFGMITSYIKESDGK